MGSRFIRAFSAHRQKLGLPRLFTGLPESGLADLPIDSKRPQRGWRGDRVSESKACFERELQSQRISLTQVLSSPTSILKSIRSMLVLYGSVRSTPLARRIDRSLLDLPLNEGTILSHQLDNAQHCATRFGLEEFEMRVLVDTDSTAPAVVPDQQSDGVRCTIEQDASPIRGVAGVLSDATQDMDEDDFIVVTSGAQVYLERLDDLVQAMAKKCADVTLVSSRDGSPVGVWLIRVGVLRSVKPIGYIDLKEQSLEVWKQDHAVRVVERSRAYVHPARSLSEYLDAVRAHASGYGAGATIDEDPYREDWESSFSIAEPQSIIGDGVILHDSIALAGSVVGKGAVVVRSVLCPGAKIDPGARVTEQVVRGSVKKGRAS